jgi:hypothetical protein
MLSLAMITAVTIAAVPVAAITLGLALASAVFFSLSCFVLAGANPAFDFATPVVSPPRAAGDALVIDLAGLAGAFVERASDAAVGLLRRSAELLLRVTFLVGVGSCGAALRDLAREAAVGANKPDGVLGRALEGVLGRVVDEGVFVRDGVEGNALGPDLVYLTAEEVDVTDWPVCCGLIG